MNQTPTLDQNECQMTWRSNYTLWVNYLKTSLKNYEKQGREYETLGKKEKVEQNRGDLIRVKRQLRALYAIENAAFSNLELLKALIDPSSLSTLKAPNKTSNREWIHSLHKGQIDAVEKALDQKPLVLIQGPPGTGKTTVISEICLQTLAQNPHARILICSETHVAVDHVLEKLETCNPSLAILRLGVREEKLNPHSTIKTMIPQAILGQYLDVLQQSGEFESSFLDGLGEIFSSSDQRALERDLLHSFSVVGTTCNGLARFHDQKRPPTPFDLVIIDEVCKATFPEVIIPLLSAQKAVLVGDPNQLPPTFCEEERSILDELKIKDQINKTFLDFLFEHIPDTHKAFLNKQFRMTNEIGDFISHCFYDNQLQNGVDRSDPQSLLWLHCRSREKYPPVGPHSTQKSPSNPDEVQRILESLEEFQAQLFADPHHQEKYSVALISPYKGQVRLLRKHLRSRSFPLFEIEVNTIDAFQGKDADLVFFSIARNHGSMRFFGDPKRLNVALSRAKKRLWIVGDHVYLQKHPVLRKIYQFIHQRHST